MLQPDDHIYLNWLQDIEATYSTQGPLVAMGKVDKALDEAYNPLIALRKGVLFARMSNWMEAYNILNSIETKNESKLFVGFPEEWDWLTVYANVLIHIGKFEKAEKILQKAITLEQTSVDISPFLLIVQLYLSEGNFERAETELAKLRKVYPENVDVMLADARLKSNKGDLSSAIDLSSSVLAQDATNLLAHEILGLAFFKQKNYEQAIRVLENSLNIWPYNIQRLTLYIDALMEVQDYARALEFTEIGMQAFPSVAYFYYRKASIIFYEDLIEEALACAYKSVELDPTQSSYWTVLALILHSIGEGEKAEKALEEALSRKPISQHAMALKNFMQAEK